MHCFILGLGHIGKALAKALKQQGHRVSGSTTSPEKVAALSELVDAVHVLKGEESDKLRQAAAGCDLIIVTVAPNVRQTRTREERETHYHQVLELSCRHAAAACQRVIFLSSFSVYGDGGNGTDPISENTPTANHDEPSSKYYQAAEQAVLQHRSGCVLRYPDMYGAPGDLDFPARVRMALDYFGGKTVFSADAPLYAIHFDDVVRSVLHAIEQQLSGIYNVCDNERVPYSNQQVFDAICRHHGWPELTYSGQILAPNRKISADKLYATGFRVQQPDPNARWVE
ncbi:NAD-dependent epimerase/dehydratase family protein [Alkalimonas sp.]|uniref:NAD-dependent epimerase/dehydratase family protein n=1 Tax=Alkalimonas sp. TaxID=1872453 RepID=UPI00263AFAFE|nr:NAD-dependent epimerase/dehydratase family protein [Alkalimonas sp.]MCC5825014.1 NAD-dependent epimerase/dehydratase family protein [Alkalimonas sp.]